MTVSEWQNVIIVNLFSRGITVSDNPYSIRRIWTYVMAFCSFTIETLFHVHVDETEDRLQKKNPPTKPWYAAKALAYQHGFSLNTTGKLDEFDNTGYTDTQIEESKIVKYTAIIRQVNPYGHVLLRIKLAGSNGGDLVQLEPEVVDGVTAYFDRVGAAGDNLSIESLPFDKIKMKWVIYYDPLILSSQGGRLDGTDSDVVRKAIKSFLRDQSQAGGMPFSGTYVRTFHTDWVQKVKGVVIPKILEAKAQYGNLPFADIDEKYDPDAGWIRFNADSDLDIQYIAQGEI